jgi:hypothetical protein
VATGGATGATGTTDAASTTGSGSGVTGSATGGGTGATGATGARSIVGCCCCCSWRDSVSSELSSLPLLLSPSSVNRGLRLSASSSSATVEQDCREYNVRSRDHVRQLRFSSRLPSSSSLLHELNNFQRRQVAYSSAARTISSSRSARK